MSFTYTNRRGVTYHLCEIKTAKDAKRLVFKRTPEGTAVSSIPDGHEVRESVNGQVSLAKARPMLLTPREIKAVEAAIGRLPDAMRYRLDVKDRQVTVYERVGPSAVEIVRKIHGETAFISPSLRRYQEEDAMRARFTPILRFTLIDDQTRSFKVERMSYRSFEERWLSVFETGSIGELAASIIPTLGQDGFFDLF